MFEAHNTKSSEGEEVVVFADGDEAAIKAFCSQVETERPACSNVSNVVFDGFEGDVMKIGEYAQFCATVQLNKAIPVLLDLRDSMHEVRKNTAVTPQILDEIKAVRKTTDATFEEIKAVRKTTDATFEEIKAVRKTTDATFEEIKAVRKTTDATFDEIKGLREDIQPGYGMTLGPGTGRCPSDKGTLGHAVSLPPGQEEASTARPK
jgi:uncharacterized protein with HEPN domain